MNDDQHFLANAYLDGELTDDERRIAEADPDVMSEVDRLRVVQSLLRTVEPPSAAARTAAIAAAMIEFSTAPAVGTGATSTNVVPLTSRRPAYGRYLGIAAAVVAIGVGGLLIAGQSGGDDDDESADVMSQEVRETFARNTVPASESPESSSASSATTAAQADTSLAATAADEMMAEAAPSADAAADSGASATIAAGASLYPTTGGPVEIIADREQTITSPGQLAGLGVLLAGLRESRDLGATPETRCAFDDPLLEIVDTARYRVDESGTTQTVLVALINDGIEGHTAAIDPDTCVVILVGP